MEALLSRFAQEHFGQARLGDARRTKRLVKAADRIVRHPGGTLPAKMGTPADLKALYRLVDRDAVTHAAVMETHRQLTLSRMRECQHVVLLVHDTTQLDYTGKHSLANLGQIAKGFHRGYLCHNTLAVREGGAVIGLARSCTCGPRCQGRSNARRGATAPTARAACGSAAARRWARRPRGACGWTCATGGRICLSTWTTSTPRGAATSCGPSTTGSCGRRGTAVAR